MCTPCPIQSPRNGPSPASARPLITGRFQWPRSSTPADLHRVPSALKTRHCSALRIDSALSNLSGRRQSRMRPAVFPGQSGDLQRRLACPRVVGVEHDQVALGPFQNRFPAWHQPAPVGRQQRRSASLQHRKAFAVDVWACHLLRSPYWPLRFTATQVAFSASPVPKRSMTRAASPFAPD